MFVGGKSIFVILGLVVIGLIILIIKAFIDLKRENIKKKHNSSHITQSQSQSSSLSGDRGSFHLSQSQSQSSSSGSDFAPNFPTRIISELGDIKAEIKKEMKEIKELKSRHNEKHIHYELRDSVLQNIDRSNKKIIKRKGE